MVSLEGLTKVVDPSQLTADFDGSLDYNHEEWIEVKLPPLLNLKDGSHYPASLCFCLFFVFFFIYKSRCAWRLRSSLVTPPRC